MLRDIEIYVLIFFTYSFLGWMMESVGGILNVKKFVNRGFFIGPYCPVYGTGVVLISLLLQNYTNDIVILFVLSVLISGILEYLTSYFMEKWFNARWWDYHNRKFNINGRICLETLLPFGIAATVIIKILNPFFINIFLKINENILHIGLLSLIIFFIFDVIISFKIMFSFKNATYADEDNTEEISNKVKDKAEDMIMKAESEFIVFSRTLKVKRLKFGRKMKYSGKRITDIIKKSPEQLNKKRILLSEKMKLETDKLNMKVKQTKDNVELKTKQSIEKIDSKIKELKNTSDEITKKVKEKFSKKSILTNRLLEAFPNLEVKKFIKKNKEK